MMKHAKKLILLLTLALSVGCSAFGPTENPKWNPFPKLSKSKTATVLSEAASLAVIWKDSVYEKPGVKSIRGFGGRVFLYDGNSQPIRSEGELIVYGYDESNADRSDSGADKKFVFKQEQFQTHFSKTDLGASYSVWIPWEEIGGYRKSITLIPVFKTAGGQLLRCGHSINVLPGKNPEQADHAVADKKTKTAKKSLNLVAQASFENNVDASKTNAANTRLRTTTLNVPPSLAKKLTNGKSRPRHESPTAVTLTPSSESSPDNQAADIEADAVADPKPSVRIFGVPGKF